MASSPARQVWRIGIVAVLLGTTGAWSTACGYLGPPVAVYGTPADVERLTGRWTGEYVNTLQGRRGTIFFAILPGERDGRGDVVMTPERAQPYQRYDQRAPVTGDPVPVPTSGVLTIRFVRTYDNTVVGTLDPYWDPERGTEAIATFMGRMNHDRIDGEYRTTFANGAPSAAGRWSVRREVEK